MFERRLRERIMAGEAPRRGSVEISAVLDDVLAHLAELFNIRQGSVPARPDYGMADINDMIHDFPDAIDAMRAEIRQQIEAFEPRLRDVAVRHIADDDDGLRMVFAVAATLVLGTRTQRVAIEAEVGDNGFVRVAA
ncbi:MAG: type VI secretion system baseplate subunit TssE [Rhodospirillales bacterium]|nr:type VI secretion system baseplate subunit TssE [Rhodospirillales bacterium]